MQDLESASQLNITEEQQLLDDLKAYEDQIVEFEDFINDPLESDNIFADESSISTKTLILNGTSKFEELDAELLNNVNVQELLDNVLDINQGFDLPIVKFGTFHASEPIVFEKLNKVAKDKMIHTNSNLSFEHLMIEGKLHLQLPLLVEEKINNVIFNGENLLLKTGDQTFGDFSVEYLVVNNVTAKFLNNTDQEQTGEVTEVEELKVKDLKIGGYINGVKISTLNKYALRNSGDQDIVVPCYFNYLEVDNLDTKNLSGKITNVDR